MKRLALKLVLFLLLGAIVNVAVAWGLALWMDLDWNRSGGRVSYDHFSDWGLPADHPDAGRFVGYGATRMRRFGAERVDISHDWDFEGSPFETTVRFEDIIPPWSLAFFDIPELRGESADWGHESDTHWAFVDARGWPALALWGGLKLPTQGRFVYDDHGKRIPLVERHHWTILIERPKPGGSLADFRWLPLRPIWPGFAINTIFYAAVLWLLFAAPGLIRRRLRHFRGRCLHCGYDLRGQPSDSNKCPECGNMVIVKCMGLPPLPGASAAQES